MPVEYLEQPLVCFCNGLLDFMHIHEYVARRRRRRIQHNLASQNWLIIRAHSKIAKSSRPTELISFRVLSGAPRP